jgi:DNA-binding IclR family transcriptional regulator
MPDGDSKAMPGGEPEGLRGLRRALGILDLLSEERPAWTTREVVEATELPKTTVVRQLQALEILGLLWVDEQRRYVAGPNLLRWSMLAADRWRVSPEALQAVRDAAELSGESAQLYVRRGPQQVCIAQHTVRHALSYSVRTGENLPLWLGGATHVLLIGASEERMRHVAEVSPQGPAILAELVASARRVADAGYGVCHDRPEPGITLVAVPVRGAGGRVIASLSVGGPSARLGSERIPKIAELLNLRASRLGDTDFADIPQSSFATREGSGKSWTDPV